MKKKCESLIGKKVNLWFIKGPIQKSPNNANRQIFCVCECGAERWVAAGGLVNGKSKSCGSRKHRPNYGNVKHPLYRSWIQMHARCRNNLKKGNHRYFGRGIKVCKRWDNFQTFIKDVGEKPPGTSLDRINNNGDYSPSNCRWATPKEQALNRCDNKYHLINGRKYTVSQISDITKIGRTALYKRVWKNQQILKQDELSLLDHLVSNCTIIK